VRAFSLASTDQARQTADLVIGTCVPRNAGYAGGPYYACSAGGDAPAGSASSLALLALLVARRRRGRGR